MSVQQLLGAAKMAGLDGSSTTALHKECQRSRVRKDEEAVQSLVDTLQGWENPFKNTKGTAILNISSGAVASAQVQDDLLIAYEKE